MTMTRAAVASLFRRILKLLRTAEVTATIAAIAVVVAGVAWVQSTEASAHAAKAATVAAGVAQQEATRASEQAKATQAIVTAQLDIRNLIFCKIIAGLGHRSPPLVTLYNGLQCPRLLPNAPASHGH